MIEEINAITSKTIKKGKKRRPTPTNTVINANNPYMPTLLASKVKSPINPFPWHRYQGASSLHMIKARVKILKTQANGLASHKNQLAISKA